MLKGPARSCQKHYGDGFRAVALEPGCHGGLVVMWLSRSGWGVTSVAETVPETMH